MPTGNRNAVAIGCGGGASPESFTRAADDDRAAVAAEPARAHDEGRLSPAEFDERTRAAYQARTFAELNALTADLPPVPAVPGRRRSTAAKVPSGAWFLATSGNILVRGVVSFAVGEAVHPWWTRVAGPRGLLLLGAHLARFGRSR